MKLNTEVLKRTSTYVNLIAGTAVSIITVNALEAPIWIKAALIGSYITIGAAQVVSFKRSTN